MILKPKLNVQICLASAIVISGLVGCVTVKPIVGPDGTENQLLTCSAIEMCYDKATEICGGPYKIVNTNTETSGFDGSTSSVIKLLIKCGK